MIKIIWVNCQLSLLYLIISRFKSSTWSLNWLTYCGRKSFRNSINHFKFASNYAFFCGQNGLVYRSALMHCWGKLPFNDRRTGDMSKPMLLELERKKHSIISTSSCMLNTVKNYLRVIKRRRKNLNYPSRYWPTQLHPIRQFIYWIEPRKENAKITGPSRAAGPSFLGGSCVLGLGLVGVRFRIRVRGRVSISIRGRVRVSLVWARYPTWFKLRGRNLRLLIVKLSFDCKCYLVNRVPRFKQKQGSGWGSSDGGSKCIVNLYRRWSKLCPI